MIKKFNLNLFNATFFITRVLCETVKEFATRILDASYNVEDQILGEKCAVLQIKLDLLLQTLNHEEIFVENVDMDRRVLESETYSFIGGELEKGVLEKPEKDITNFKRVRKERNLAEKDTIMSRANSLKRAIRQVVQEAVMFIDEQRNITTKQPSNKTQNSSVISEDTEANCAGKKERQFSNYQITNSENNMFLVPTIVSSGSSDISPCPSPTPNLISLSPMPDLRRDSQAEELLTLPAPDGFADSRRNSSNMPQM